MALDLETIQQVNTDKIGFFRFKKFDNDQYLITNDAGKFQFLLKFHQYPYQNLFHFAVDHAVVHQCRVLQNFRYQVVN